MSDRSPVVQFFADFLPGRDPDYQTLNLTFAVNVIKYATLISLFPKPFKPCVIKPLTFSYR